MISQRVLRLYRHIPKVSTLQRSFRYSSPLMTNRAVSFETTPEIMGPMDASTLFQADKPFIVTSHYQPAGDQPAAIQKLTSKLRHKSCKSRKKAILNGATGTGKTFVMAQTIAKLNQPTLVMCPNKTLAAQLARELRSHLGENCVELFVSYYNYYTPEAYNPVSDKYTEKVSSINEELDALRHRCTRSLFERRDVVVVASVSCIYGLGLPIEYVQARLRIQVGTPCGWGSDLVDLDRLLRKVMYTKTKSHRSDEALKRGEYYTIQGSDKRDGELMIWPPYEESPLHICWNASTTETTSDPSPVISSIKSVAIVNEENYFNSTGTERERSISAEVDSLFIYPARHFVTSEEQLETAILRIEQEMKEQVQEFQKKGQFDMASRLETRVKRDVVMMRETGFCTGMENYSRHLAGRDAGEPPETLIDYFTAAKQTAVLSSRRHNQDINTIGNTRRYGKRNVENNDIDDDWLLVVDESHVTVPQIRAMYAGDRARKLKLVEHGFRLPSAADNRPLTDTEFWKKIPKALFVSATPGATEMKMTAEAEAEATTAIATPVRRLKSLGSAVAPLPEISESEGASLAPVEVDTVDMVVRPTYVLDPVIHVRPAGTGQLDDLLGELRARKRVGERGMVLTLMKRDSEDLAAWLQARGINSAYLHADLNTIERSEVLQNLQNGTIDVVVGVNLLREGLDLPQVSLVAVLDADKEGFLRSSSSLIQIVGRAARNVRGEAIFYANKMTKAMQKCIDDTAARRNTQILYNEKHGTVPISAEGREVRSIFDIFRDELTTELAEQRVLKSSTTLVSTLPTDKSDATTRDIEVYDTFAGQYSMNDCSVAVLATPVLPPVVEAKVSRAELPRDDSFSGEASSLTPYKYVTSPAVMDASHVDRLRMQVANLPQNDAGVYMWKDQSGDILYIGKAKRLRTRAQSYLKHITTAATATGVGNVDEDKHQKQQGYLVSGSRRIRTMIRKAQTLDFIVTPGGERDALLLESSLIKYHQPPFNVLLRDDKSFPYICISRPITGAVGAHQGNRRNEIASIHSVPYKPSSSSSSFPSSSSSSAAASSARGARRTFQYFGPFTSNAHIRAVLEKLEQLFHLRQLAFEARFGGASDNSVNTRMIDSDASDAADAGLLPAQVEEDVLERHQRAVDRCAMILRGDYDQLMMSLSPANGTAAADSQLLEQIQYLRRQGGVYAQVLSSSSEHQPHAHVLPSIPAAVEEGFCDFLSDVLNSDGNGRDVVAVAVEGDARDNDASSSASNCTTTDSGSGIGCTVQIIQLRHGCVRHRFHYRTLIPDVSDVANLEEYHYSEAIQRCLENHYSSYSSLSSEDAETNVSFFPEEILSQFPVMDAISLQDIVNGGARDICGALPCLRVVAVRDNASNNNTQNSSVQLSDDGDGLGKREWINGRIMEFAIANAQVLASRFASEESATSTAMRDLQSLLSLPHLPRRIEGYDISHTQGVGTVASRVTFLDGRPAAAQHRTYDIKGISTGEQKEVPSAARVSAAPRGEARGDALSLTLRNDDYASLEEVVFRRFRYHRRSRGKTAGPRSIDTHTPGVLTGSHSSSSRSSRTNSLGSSNADGLQETETDLTLPDLLLIDGGKGQLTAAVKGLLRAGLEMQSLNSSVSGAEQVMCFLVPFKGQSARPTKKYITLCSLAKAKEEVYVLQERQSKRREVQAVLVPSQPLQPALRLLRAVRDESHRVALKKHRRRRSLLSGL